MTFVIALFVCTCLPLMVQCGGRNTGDSTLKPFFLGKTGQCIEENCSKQMATCLFNTQCRDAIFCSAVKCLNKKNQDACNLLCELTYGYNSTKYREFMQCAVDHACMPISPPDGTCVAKDSDAIKNLTSMAQVKGKWWILRGLNCGQNGWPGAFDDFPCQRDDFVYENGHWVDHIAYCGGSNNTCSTSILYTVANASISASSPGVMSHDYTDPPLRPQIEQWRVLSWPHRDWMLYIYCGRTPVGVYAGGSVVNRSESPPNGTIPDYVEREFKTTAHRFGFDYDAMCVSDLSNCSV